MCTRVCVYFCAMNNNVRKRILTVVVSFMAGVCFITSPSLANGMHNTSPTAILSTGQATIAESSVNEEVRLSSGMEYQVSHKKCVFSFNNKFKYLK